MPALLLYVFITVGKQYKMSALDVFHQYYAKLVSSLPIKNDLFTAGLAQNHLLHDKMKFEIAAKETNANAADYFLQNAIKPALDSGITEPFEKLLTVMEKFDGVMESLAVDIRQKLKVEGGAAPNGLDAHKGVPEGQ